MSTMFKSLERNFYAFICIKVLDMNDFIKGEIMQIREKH